MGSLLRDSRPTFQEAYAKIVVDSRLRQIACGNIMPLNRNWELALNADIKDVHTLVDHLCKDLSIVTGKKIVRASRLFMEDWIPHPEEVLLARIERLWELFVRRYQSYIKQVLFYLRPEPKPNNPVIYPISKVSWEDETSTFDFPTPKLTVQKQKLRNAVMTNPEEVEVPVSVRSKLYALQTTYFNLQPQIIKSRDGQALIVRLGDHWSDFVIASWTTPHRQSWRNLYTEMLPWIAGCLTFTGLATWSGFQLVNGSWWQIAIAVFLFISSILSFGASALMIGVLFSNKFASLKV